MMKAGMDVVRFNLSHGTHASHRASLRLMRGVAKEAGKYVPAIADLQGPKIRLGVLPEKGIQLKTEEIFIFSTAITEYKGKEIPVTYEHLHKDVKANDRFLIDDGLIELIITKVEKRNIHARVINGGLVTSHKGMNFPDSRLSVGAITRKDEEDITFAVESGFDWIALSFVKSAKEVRRLRQLIVQSAKPKQVLPRIIVKIEKHEAIEAFSEILEATDAVMVARGDLGVEIPAEQVPIQQKQIIEKCRTSGKPVIVATQMLDSMMRSPRPTRAEVSDVANAVFDHTDAVMLSGESASGNYPLKAVQMMTKIIHDAEASPFDDVALITSIPNDPVASVAHTLKLAAVQGSIQAVVVSLELADWSETVLRAHPEIPLFIACQNEVLARQVALRWGSVPFVLPRVQEKTFVTRVLRVLKIKRLLKKNTRVAMVLGGSHGMAFDIIEVS